MKPSCAPFSGEISGRIAVIIPIPTNEIDATASSDERRDEVRVRRGARPKNSATTANSSAVRTSAVERRANVPIPSRCTGRASGAMNVYSIVPSQRSHATVSVRISKMIPR